MALQLLPAPPLQLPLLLAAASQTLSALPLRLHAGATASSETVTNGRALAELDTFKTQPMQAGSVHPSSLRRWNEYIDLFA